MVWIPDDGLAETVLDPMQRYSVTRRVETVEEVVGLLADGERWSGLVVDLDAFSLPRAKVALGAIRECQPLVSVLALCGHPTVELVNIVHSQRAELVCKPVALENLVAFVQRALVNGWLPDARVCAWVDELARRQDLTAREVQLMAYALGNEPRPRVMRRLGITENTLKTQVRALLRKCSARSMDELAKNVLREALIHDSRETAVPDADDSGAFRLAMA